MTSRIDSPASGDSLRAGARQVVGIAWAPTVGVGGVEVQVDDGPWLPARLSAPVSGSLWRQFALDWDATPGKHRLRVRATDASGAVQVSEEQPAYPSGATGLHSVTVRVG